MVYEGKYYGTLKSDIDRIWKENKIPVLDIDVQGAIHVQQQYPVNTIAIFIQAPSAEELKRRLKSWFRNRRIAAGAAQQIQL